MTADGTYPVPRVGVTVSTAAELAALPVGSVVLSHCTGGRARFDGLAWQKRKSGAGDDLSYTPEWWGAYDSEWLPEPKMVRFLRGSFTVLFRPDAPQPATGDDWAARANDASRAAAIELRAEAAGDLLIQCATTTNHSMLRRDVDNALDAVWQAGHDAALAAARAGEAEEAADLRAQLDAAHAQIQARDREVEQERADAVDLALRIRGEQAAQGGGEAVDREALAEMLRAHHWHTGKPSTERCRCGAAVPWVGDAGEDIRRHQADVILAARGDAAPTASAEQVTEAARLLWEHQTGYRRDQAPASALDDRQRQVRRVLGVLGIEVRG